MNTAKYNENDPLCQRLSERIDYLLTIKRVKDPELMMSALEVLTNLADACHCLLEDLGEPEDSMQANLMKRCKNIIATHKLVGNAK